MRFVLFDPSINPADEIAVNELADYLRDTHGLTVDTNLVDEYDKSLSIFARVVYPYDTRSAAHYFDAPPPSIYPLPDLYIDEQSPCAPKRLALHLKCMTPTGEVRDIELGHNVLNTKYDLPAHMLTTISIRSKAEIVAAIDQPPALLPVVTPIQPINSVTAAAVAVAAPRSPLWMPLRERLLNG